MKTELLHTMTTAAEDAAVAAAIDTLRSGGVVALPTETVYGLAADALNPAAVARIFEAKERPLFDPLIVHLPDDGWLDKVAVIEDRERVLRITEAFWPGPLTLVVPRREIVPDLVTSGLDTVAVRRSAHPVFQRVIHAFGGPLAAPSANRFGRISPTLGAHVVTELGGRIALVVDAGPTGHGVESTIIQLAGEEIRILRPGPVTAEALAEFGKVTLLTAHHEKPASPGTLPLHYAPATPLQIVRDPGSFEVGPGRRCGLLAWDPEGPVEAFAQVEILSRKQDLVEAAARLFGALRELDAAGLDLIIAEPVPEAGLGVAIMDRLRRASHP